MTLFQLNCFQMLARCLNFTQASKELFITQPTLSRSIVALEEELGFPLFERTSRVVHLTNAGQVFYKECDNIMDALNHGIEQARLASEWTSGTIRVGLPNNSFSQRVIDILLELKKEYPGIDLQIVMRRPTELVNALDNDQVDIIIASGKPRSANICSLLFENSVDCVVLPVSHPLSDRKTIAMQELQNEKFILTSRTTSLVGYENVFLLASQAGFIPDVVHLARTVNEIITLVSLNVGISILYEDHKIEKATGVRFIPLQERHMFSRYLMWKKDGNKLVQLLVDQVERQLPLI